MPALDRLHQTVKNALVKDGWTITNDPLVLKLPGRTLMVDLGAEKILLAEKESRQIAVEIKVFGSLSLMADLQQAVGQHTVYRKVLAQHYPQYELYTCDATSGLR